MQKLQSVGGRVKAVMVAGLSLVGVSVAPNVSAQAVLPTEASGAITEIGEIVPLIEAAIWPVIGLVLVAFITIKLVKRGANKI